MHVDSLDQRVNDQDQVLEMQHLSRQPMKHEGNLAPTLANTRDPHIKGPTRKTNSSTPRKSHTTICVLDRRTKTKHVIKAYVITFRNNQFYKQSSSIKELRTRIFNVALWSRLLWTTGISGAIMIFIH